MPKDLLKFLFEDSFKPTSDESISDFFEKLSEIENLEVKSGPLKKALKALGYAGDVCAKPDDTAEICVDNAKDYSELVGLIKSPDSLLALAELGWVPILKDDDQDALAAKPNFVIGFISISDPTPSDDDKIADLEKLLKDANDAQLDDKEDGIGADLDAGKLPDGKKKDLTVPVVKDPKKAMHEEKSDETLTNDANYVCTTLEAQGLDSELKGDPDTAEETLVTWMNADEEDALPGFWNLFSNMEQEDLKKVAAKVIDMLGIAGRRYGKNPQTGR
jgi:hypothetical protein